MRCNVDYCTGNCLGCKKGEQNDVLERFMSELRKPTKDGGKKRSRKEKPPWYVDQSHHKAMFSHYYKWLAGETVDADSGAHPLVHLAWRALAIACQETGNVPALTKAEERYGVCAACGCDNLNCICDSADGFA